MEFQYRIASERTGGPTFNCCLIRLPDGPKAMSTVVEQCCDILPPPGENGDYHVIAEGVDNQGKLRIDDLHVAVAHDDGWKCAAYLIERMIGIGALDFDRDELVNSIGRDDTHLTGAFVLASGFRNDGQFRRRSVAAIQEEFYQGTMTSGSAVTRARSNGRYRVPKPFACRSLARDGNGDKQEGSPPPSGSDDEDDGDDDDGYDGDGGRRARSGSSGSGTMTVSGPDGAPLVGIKNESNVPIKAVTINVNIRMGDGSRRKRKQKRSSRSSSHNNSGGGGPGGSNQNGGKRKKKSKSSCGGRGQGGGGGGNGRGGGGGSEKATKDDPPLRR
ncbi:hypothetical protein THAOC_19414 [Thalassiosira oceanica]|uniref:Uncharacterized protein n=1 Tax=Thalassiosira oceanica TaxID=159749 RepID=K0S2I2_THAOC|nr:hypothetical protein THAOC_19414 [Thalassiosira oceanica]|eukprot:EJK60263.1 hypothetical protein THAOC_19414 [Thalassiosira oceanica]